MKHEDVINIGEIVLQKLKEKDRTVTWLARKIERDPSNLKKN